MSKLSVHITFPGDARGYGDFLRICNEKGNPVSLVYQCNSNTKNDVINYSPSTKLVFRRQSTAWPRLPQMFTDDAKQNCEDWMLNTKENDKNLLDYWRLNPSDYYDPLNEPVVATGPASKAIWLNTWMVHALEIANAHGFKLALFSFPFGDPDYPMWDYFHDALRLGKQSGAILSLHAYTVSGPMIVRNPDGSLSENTKHWTLRHRQIYNSLPEDCRLPLIISEASSGNGYDTGMDGQAYLNDAIEFDKEIMKDSYVISANLFQLGGSQSNLQPILADLTKYVSTTPTTIPPIEPPPVTTLPYVVIGHLAPQNATLDQMKYVQEQAYPTRSTVAQSADDVRFLVKSGQPGSKAVIYNPESWPGGTQGIFDYFKGLNIEFKYFGANSTDFWLNSPILEIPFYITDPFNAPRDYANGKHEGLDLDCYDDINKKIVDIHAAQSGIVEKVYTQYSGTGYGKHIIIRHDWHGQVFKTWYCHMSEITVTEGQSVIIGDKIGVGGNTGTQAIHLHLNLQWIGNGLNGYVTPDVVNPIDFINLKPTNITRSGVGLANLNILTQPEIDAIKLSKVTSVFALTLPDKSQSQKLIQQLKSISPTLQIIGRLFFSADSKNKTLFNPQDFIAFCKNGLDGFYAEGVRIFQVHNEPNIESEGLGWNWHNGTEFGTWLREVIRLLKLSYPDIQIIYPGLSPQPNTEQFFMDSTDKNCDAVGVHAYWYTKSGGQWNMIDESGGMSWKAVKRHTSKPIYLTEYSNNNPNETYANKGIQYKEYISLLGKEGIMTAFSFALSWPGQDINKEAWVNNNIITDIPKKLGE